MVFKLMARMFLIQVVALSISRLAGIFSANSLASDALKPADNKVFKTCDLTGSRCWMLPQAIVVSCDSITLRILRISLSISAICWLAPKVGAIAGTGVASTDFGTVCSGGDDLTTAAGSSNSALKGSA